MATAAKAYILSYFPPFLFNDRLHQVFAEGTPRMDYDFPQATWVHAKKSKDGIKMPQTVAHRGYKAEFPENTMAAFQGAVNVGSDGIETDIHLSKDGEVVLSHDATLKRCFDRPETIINCDWEYLSTLRTSKEPAQPMPRLRDLLEYLATPGLEHIWLLLDIKLDNNADDVMRLIAKTISEVPPSPDKAWNKRIVLGCWALKFLPLCDTYLPTFPITHIGFSTSYAREFLAYPHISFNMLQKALLIPPSGPRFVRDVQHAGRALFVWTVNDDDSMRWSINAGVDAVITDDPKRFRDVCDQWRRGNKHVHMGLGLIAHLTWLYVMLLLFGALLRWKHGVKRQPPPAKTAPATSAAVDALNADPTGQAAPDAKASSIPVL